MKKDKRISTLKQRLLKALLDKPGCDLTDGEVKILYELQKEED